MEKKKVESIFPLPILEKDYSIADQTKATEAKPVHYKPLWKHNKLFQKDS
jgi:hypothetical protein